MPDFFRSGTNADYSEFDRASLRRAFGVADEVDEAVPSNDSVLVSRVRVASRAQTDPARLQPRLRVKRASSEGYREVDERSELFDALGFSKEAALVAGETDVPEESDAPREKTAGNPLASSPLSYDPATDPPWLSSLRERNATSGD